MIHAVITGLIDRAPLEAMPDNQPKLDKQVQRIIERGPAHPEVIVLNEAVAEFFEGEMAFRLIDGFEDGIAFWRLAMIVHLKVTVENPQNSLPNVNSNHISGCYSKNRTKVQTFKEIKEILSIKNLN